MTGPKKFIAPEGNVAVKVDWRDVLTVLRDEMGLPALITDAKMVEVTGLFGVKHPRSIRPRQMWPLTDVAVDIATHL